MRIWTVDLTGPRWMDTPEAEAAAKALTDSGLVAVPTETVYGLAAIACDGEACAKIYEAKGRPQFNPLISHVESIERAQTHGAFSPKAEALAKAFWPGPLTLVVPRLETSSICALATAGLDTVALRVPAAPVMRFLAQKTGCPIAAPSANLSGKISPTTADDVAQDLGSKLAWLVDAGPCQVGVESTILEVVGDKVRLLRPGGTAREEIEALLGHPVETAAPLDGGQAPQAPGMLSSHYAPNARVRLNASHVQPGEALLAFGPDAVPGQEAAVQIANLSETASLTEAAARLFSALRVLDASGAAQICVAPIPYEGLGEAIHDRLARAAAPR